MRCTNCHLCKEATKQCVPTGSDHPLIYFVGEAPGKEEDAEGVPFIGRSGKLLRSTLQELGIDDSLVRIFNIVRCIPRNGTGVRAPSDEEKLACHQYLYADIYKSAPAVVIPLGNSSASFLLADHGYAGISKSRGKVYRDVEISYNWIGEKLTRLVRVVPSYHPSYLLRNGCKDSLMDLFRSDIQLALSEAEVTN